MPKIVNILSQILSGLAAFAMLLMMIQVTADVAGKYIFNRPIPGTAEVVAHYFMVASVFLPLATVEARDNSIVVDLFYDLLPRGGRRVVLTTALALTVIFYSGLAWLSWEPAMQAWRIGEVVEGTWQVVVWPTKFILPIGLSLAAVVSALRCLQAALGCGHPGYEAEIIDPA